GLPLGTQEGAFGPKTAKETRPDPARGSGFKIRAEDRAFWSFRPVTPTAAPTVKGRDWVKTPIDAFVLSKLESKDLKPSEPADKRTLIRRATFDLIGLPPTPEEVDAFLKDDAPDAFA